MSAVLVESGPDQGAIWHFGEPNNEQKALAKGNGWADLSHRAVISITGKDRLTWLHALTTQDLEKLQVATWVDALILDVQGHVIDQLFLVDDGQSVWLHLEKERLAPLIDYLNKIFSSSGNLTYHQRNELLVSAFSLIVIFYGVDYLVNGSGTIYLISNNTLIDYVSYDADWHFALLDDDDGKTLERLDPLADANSSSNWHTAAEALLMA